MRAGGEYIGDEGFKGAACGVVDGEGYCRAGRKVEGDGGFSVEGVGVVLDEEKVARNALVRPLNSRRDDSQAAE